MPIVSVIIPTYNSAKYLPEALESVFNQTVKDIEVIVVDDGSTDNTKLVVDAYKDRVKYLYIENSGPGAARNKGIRESTSKFIAFLDSDDTWEHKYLEEQVFLLQNSRDAALVYSGKLWVDENGKLLEHAWTQHEFPEGWIFERLFEDNYISSSSCVVTSKDALLQVGGFNESYVIRSSEDYELWLRISALYSCLSTPKCMVRYRRHSNNLTKQTVNHIKAHLAALNSAGSLILNKKVDLRNYSGQINVRDRFKGAYKEAIISLFYADEYSAVRSIGWEAITNNYYSINLIFLWCISLLPKKLIKLSKKLRKYLKRECV